MEKIEDTLGPRSASADLDSLTSHSYKSRRSEKSKGRSFGKKRNGKNESEVSYGSKSTYTKFSTQDVASIMSKVSSSMSTDVLSSHQKPEDVCPGKLSPILKQ